MNTRTHLYLSAGSVEDFRVKLEGLSLADRMAGDLVLGLHDPSLIVKAFSLEAASLPELRDHLLAESVEMLGLPVEGIVLEVQVLSKSNKKFNGLWTAIPKSVLDKYIDLLDRVAMIAPVMTAAALVHLSAYLPSIPSWGRGRLCFLDFSHKGELTVSVFHNQECELIRRVPYDNDEDAQQIVTQSIKSVCAKSSSKEFDYLYAFGSLVAGESFVGQLQALHDVPGTWLGEVLPQGFSAEAGRFFELNLARNYFFSPKAERQLSQGLRVLAGGLVVLILVLGVIIFIKSLEGKAAQSPDHLKAYQYALALRQTLGEAK